MTGRIFMSKNHRSLSAILGLLLLLLGSAQLCPALGAGSGNLGTDFWLTFPGSYLSSPNPQMLISCSVNTSGTVQIPGLAFSAPFTIPAGTTVSVPVPINCFPTLSDAVTQLGIHVTSLDPVAVTGLDYEFAGTDGYLALPTASEDTNYIVLAYQDDLGANYPSEFTVVAGQNGTSVTITPSVTVGARTAGVPYAISLNQGEAYQLEATNIGQDLSGTLISSSIPVGVWGAVNCVHIPASTFACN